MSGELGRGVAGANVQSHDWGSEVARGCQRLQLDDASLSQWLTPQMSFV